MDEPSVGHESYRGRISIPFVTRPPTGQPDVVYMKFRAIDDHPVKYLGLTGHERPMFFSEALDLDTDDIAIVEGEFDCMILNQCGIPAIGITGADKWRANPFLSRNLKGYRRVYVFKDHVKNRKGKKATGGDLFAKSIAETVENTHIIPMPEDDVNHAYLTRGEDYLKGLIK